MKVLVTGGEGQLGRELAEVFGSHNEVLALGRLTLDVTDRQAVLAAHEQFAPDAVVHAAAWTAVDDCETDPGRALAVNAVGTRNVASAARLVNAPVYYLSTDYVFDGTLDRPYCEWDATNPQSVYGRSKLAGEAELDPDSAVIRTSWVFGRYGSNIVKTILRLAQSRDEFTFVDDQHGSPTCAQDLAEVIRELVVGRHRGLFHVTNQGTTSWYQFAREVLEFAGLDPARIKPVATADLDPPRLAPRPMNSVLDNTALRALGLPLAPDYRQSLEQLVKSLL